MKRFFKNRKILGFMAGLLTLGMLGTNCGRGHWHSQKDPAEMAEKVTDRLADKLDLDESQETETKKLVLEIIESGKELRNHRKDMIGELEKQFASSEFDPASLNQMSEKSEAEFKKFRVTVVQNMGKFHALLTDEQKREAAEYLGEVKERFHR
ncbi:MAG TPA: hypothetical protein DEA96_03030 [Leptospiraceae bacterium]|nr:hypothetical protein [Spirochaetaceae bacterium]HBS03912.1 hypothetical protein [Leptospiraceae bacterium]|tara:strand:- start:11044 stop:11502 length:459 start_codon:yes stop_codon:yes gene_type:complete